MSIPVFDARRRRRFHHLLLSWYAREKRSFVWRTAHPDPYRSLVSEVMLQQTQAARVQVLLPPFLERFPSLEDLAAASNAEIIVAWRGLGYNSRALRLRDCARAIMRDHDGIVPQDLETLKTLPGIGPYSASAIMVFVYGADLPVIDVNIRRVYSRVARPMILNDTVLEASVLHDVAEKIFPRGAASEWHQALMDLGAVYCRARNPLCTTCPVAALCASAHQITDVQKRRSTEPSHRGTPQRIWRGRIIEALRHAPWRGVRAQQLLTTLFDESTDTDAQWLDEILARLQQEGFVRRTAQLIRLER